MNKILLAATAFMIIALSSQSCKTKSKTAAKTNDESVHVMMDSIIIDKGPRSGENERYNESSPRINDIIHTRLEVSFDWQKRYLNGKATIDVKPYFYSVDSISLDAKGFDVKKVSLRDGGSLKELKYTYDGLVLNIKLGRQFQKEEKYTLYIEYTAKPDELEAGGSSAITSDKGLYFINPDGTELNKPKQIWTQGETQASSAWFPTIDRPNERMTNEIFITIEKSFVTLSNGDLVSSKQNADGTRTDHWKMDQPHAPYLVMMAIGEFSVVKEKWKNRQVNYYVEKPYEPHAKAIFGNTPEMLDVYSKMLGVEYPWSKYSQVVVRDYVSGAMENTGAVIHGEFLQQTERELLDGDNEAIIAHELFHHWFGDLVTCESWANLPLNESFATYGEYLWMEHKYGRDAADYHGQESMSGYMRESASGKNVDLIRFNYEDKEDMFDGHSYNKGGRILHMLRKYVGDDAFFASLKLYLERNKYTSVEIHQLRLAFEEITGQDLNWFFNQWFLDKGHPALDIKYSYDEGAKTAVVKISQSHNAGDRIYRLPMKVDVYSAGKVYRHDITLTEQEQEFRFAVEKRPDLINADAEKMLLATKKENKGVNEMIFQYTHGPLYMDRYEALSLLGRKTSDSTVKQTVIKATQDKFWSLRLMALSRVGKDLSKERLIEIATKDEKAAVRARAVDLLSANYKSDASLVPVYTEALKDKAYSVVSEALNGLAETDAAAAMTAAKTFENEKSADILVYLSSLYSKHGSQEHMGFFENAAKNLSGFNLFPFITNLKKFIFKMDAPTAERGIATLSYCAENSGMSWVQMVGMTALSDVEKHYREKAEETAARIKEVESTNQNATGLAKMKEDVQSYNALSAKASEHYKKLKDKEGK